MSDTIIKVQRNIMAYRAPATLSTQYGAPWKQRLSDDVRHQMGGKDKAHFYAQHKDGKWVLLNRAPDQAW